ncbi:HalOD1 output domain-containing protein [Halorubrum sp. DTA98]|uniref:HalOD1 output domain-containing protein n=1 Tax=Halorubrum sp. DTA98 TaxID=3402163 RepID=UPI003AB00C42
MGAEQLSIYRACTPVCDVTYGGELDQTPTEAIIAAVADVADVDPTELPSLYDYIDPDAIDNLFDRHDGHDVVNTHLAFTYDTWNVFVHADGRIRICDSAQPTEPAPVFAGYTD